MKKSLMAIVVQMNSAIGCSFQSWIKICVLNMKEQAQKLLKSKVYKIYLYRNRMEEMIHQVEPPVNEGQKQR